MNFVARLLNNKGPYEIMIEDLKRNGYVVQKKGEMEFHGKVPEGRLLVNYLSPLAGKLGISYKTHFDYQRLDAVVDILIQTTPHQNKDHSKYTLDDILSDRPRRLMIIDVKRRRATVLRSES